MAAAEHDQQLSGLFNEEIYKMAIGLVGGMGIQEDRKIVTNYLTRTANVSLRTAQNYINNLLSDLEVSVTFSADGEVERTLLLDRATGLEIVPEHLVESRIACALAALEYDYDFDITKASDAEIGDRVSVC